MDGRPYDGRPDGNEKPMLIMRSNDVDRSARARFNRNKEGINILILYRVTSTVRSTVGVYASAGLQLKYSAVEQLKNSAVATHLPSSPLPSSHGSRHRMAPVMAPVGLCTQTWQTNSDFVIPSSRRRHGS